MTKVLLALARVVLIVIAILLLTRIPMLAQDTDQDFNGPNTSGGNDTAHVPYQPPLPPPQQEMRQATPQEQHQQEEHDHAGENEGSRELGDQMQKEGSAPAGEAPEAP